MYEFIVWLCACAFAVTLGGILFKALEYHPKCEWCYKHRVMWDETFRVPQALWEIWLTSEGKKQLVCDGCFQEAETMFPSLRYAELKNSQYRS